MDGLADLLKRIDRKLEIRRGMTLTYDDLALLVATGAYGALQTAAREELEQECRTHLAGRKKPGPSSRLGTPTTAEHALRHLEKLASKEKPNRR